MYEGIEPEEVGSTANLAIMGPSLAPDSDLGYSNEAEREEDNIKLNWSTASEENNDYFEIQKSYDSEVFTPIGYVDGAGNSNEVLDYSYTDSETNKAYYRLKQLDYDGEFEYSDIVVVKGNRRAE